MLLAKKLKNFKQKSGKMIYLCKTWVQPNKILKLAYESQQYREISSK